MENHPLTLMEWEAFRSQEQEEFGKELISSLPSGFDFLRIHTFERGSMRYSLAVYLWKGLSFVLIPGGLAQLGYDPATAPISSEQRLSYEEETMDLTEKSLDEYLTLQLTPRREAWIPSLLVQAIPTLLGPPRSHAYRSGDQRIDSAMVQSIVTDDGFRLLTSDEWEYVCSAGSRTLFHWGNDYPKNQEPEDYFWNLYRLPNAFGLVIAFDPTGLEFCQEPDTLHGSDGGYAGSAGIGTFAEWLPLASCFRPLQGYSPWREGYIRRVLQIGK